MTPTAISENHTRSFEEAEQWNRAFWRSQPPEAIFEAVWQMILDYQLIHHPDAGEPRLQRTVEHFGKA